MTSRVGCPKCFGSGTHSAVDWDSCRQNSEEVYCDCPVGRKKQVRDNLCACSQRSNDRCTRPGQWVNDDCLNKAAAHLRFDWIDMTRERSWGCEPGHFGRRSLDGTQHREGSPACLAIVAKEPKLGADDFEVYLRARGVRLD